MSPMNETATETVEVRLLPFEGKCLLGVLEDPASEAGDTCSRERLASIVDRLDDCQAVASWLGEYVRLELQPDEVVEILETVIAVLNSDTPQPSSVTTALSNIGEKLATFGYGRRDDRQADQS